MVISKFCGKKLNRREAKSGLAIYIRNIHPFDRRIIWITENSQRSYHITRGRSRVIKLEHFPVIMLLPILVRQYKVHPSLKPYRGKTLPRTNAVQSKRELPRPIPTPDLQNKPHFFPFFSSSSLTPTGLPPFFLVFLTSTAVEAVSCVLPVVELPTLPPEAAALISAIRTFALGSP